MVQLAYKSCQQLNDEVIVAKDARIEELEAHMKELACKLFRVKAMSKLAEYGFSKRYIGFFIIFSVGFSIYSVALRYMGSNPTLTEYALIGILMEIFDSKKTKKDKGDE